MKKPLGENSRLLNQDSRTMDSSLSTTELNGRKDSSARLSKWNNNYKSVAKLGEMSMKSLKPEDLDENQVKEALASNIIDKNEKLEMLQHNIVKLNFELKIKIDRLESLRHLFEVKS